MVGCKITHVKLPADQYRSILTGVAGIPAEHAGYLILLEEGIGGGSEERLIAEHGEKVVKGKVTFREFFEKNKAAWTKASSTKHLVANCNKLIITKTKPRFDS